MTKLTDLLKQSLNKKQEEHSPKAKSSTEKKVKNTSISSAKPVKKASGRGR
jgi:hypothetical protein